jgi:hypothetical protein
MPAVTSAISAIAPTPAVTPITPSASKLLKYSITDIVLAFFKEKAKDIAKAGSYLAFWATQAIPDLPPNVTKFNTTLRDFKNFVSATEIPEKLHKLSESVPKLGKAEGAVRKVFSETMSLINSTADSIDFANLFIPLGKEAMRWVTGINFAATLGFAGNGVAEQIQKLDSMKKIDLKATTLYLINLARDVSYVALAMIGLTFFFTATPLVPWMIVACLTSGLTFSIGSYFYEKMVDPENKGKSINPTALVDRFVAQKNGA